MVCTVVINTDRQTRVVMQIGADDMDWFAVATDVSIAEEILVEVEKVRTKVLFRKDIVIHLGRI